MAAASTRASRRATLNGPYPRYVGVGVVVVVGHLVSRTAVEDAAEVPTRERVQLRIVRSRFAGTAGFRKESQASSVDLWIRIKKKKGYDLNSN